MIGSVQIGKIVGCRPSAVDKTGLGIGVGSKIAAVVINIAIAAGVAQIGDHAGLRGKRTWSGVQDYLLFQIDQIVLSLMDLFFDFFNIKRKVFPRTDVGNPGK